MDARGLSAYMETVGSVLRRSCSSGISPGQATLDEDLGIPVGWIGQRNGPNRYSGNLLDQFRRCERRQVWYEEYCEAEGLDASSLAGTASESDDPALAAERVYGCSFEDPGSSHALTLVEAAEAQNILVMASGVVGY